MSNAERVSLRLNGRDLGTQAVDRIMGNTWSVPYAPGRIEVVAMRGGRIVARAAHETAGPPVALRLTPARTVMAGDDTDAQPITIDAVDARGRHVPTANLPTRFTVEGAAIIGVGNGDPNSHEPEKGGARSLFNGLAQIVVQAGPGRGRIVVRVEAAGLKPARLVIDRLAVPPPAQVGETVPAQILAEWRRSPALAARPSADLAPADGDNNSWAFVRAGTPTAAEAGGGWRVYRSVVVPWRGIAVGGGMLRFATVAGRAQLWVDGRLLGEKRDAAPGPFVVPFPAGEGPRRLALIVESEGGVSSRIVGPVTLALR